MKQPHEMTFSEFVEAVKPSAGMNRWPQLGEAKEVVSYSVYMNGEIVDRLPQAAREQEYRDVALHALTEKLGLDSHSLRDNLKVAEVVAVRHAYMTAVLEASMAFALSPEVQDDYALLTNQMSHPIIQAQIEEQKRQSMMLSPVLAQAEKVLGVTPHEKEAAGVSRGAVISQNEEFTVQDIGHGAVVVHENRRLQSVAPIGKNVTVVYYRGKGQIFENIQQMAFSEQYIDDKSGDLAVNLVDRAGEVKGIVLFNSMAMVAQFANEHGLGEDFVKTAFALREAAPKKMVESVARVIDGGPYIDSQSGLIAFDFREGAIKYTAVFKSAAELNQHAAQLGASADFQKQADLAESLQRAGNVLLDETKSFGQAMSEAQDRVGFDGVIKLANVKNGRYAGRVIATTPMHVAQDTGRNEVMIHDKRNLDKIPLAGERMSVKYQDGKGEVAVREFSKARETGR